MLAFVDIPEYLRKIYDKSKKLSAEIVGFFEGMGIEQDVRGNQDLLEFGPGCIFINKGFFKFLKENKLVRLYSENDALWLEDKSAYADCSLTSEFGSIVTVINKKDILKALATNSGLLETWLTWQELDTQVMRLLCSLYIEDKASPDIEIKNVNKGDVIIREGDKPDKLFIMVDGKATVTREGNNVGTIESDELFGEISFFTNQPRTSTVTALTDCFIQAMSYDDFLKTIPGRPKLIMTLSQSLSNRIITLDDKLAGK